MIFERRYFCRLAGGVAGALMMSGFTYARPYPAHQVRIIVGFPPGGPLDIVARLIAPWLSDRLERPFTVENIVGESGNVATGMVAGAPPDGSVLLLCGPVNTINTTLYAGRLAFDFARDLAAVAGIARVPLVMEVHPSVLARSVPEFIAYAKANPGKLKVAYAGKGTPQHIAIELFKIMSGVDLTLVPYPGSAAALTDLLGGKAQVMFDPMPSSMPHIRAGRLIPLGVTSVERSNVLPDISAISDFVPNYEGGSWFGIVAPRGTPGEVIGALSGGINSGIADAGLKQRPAQLGATPMPGSPADFAAFVADETVKYRRVIDATGISADEKSRLRDRSAAVND